MEMQTIATIITTVLLSNGFWMLIQNSGGALTADRTGIKIVRIG